MAARDPDWLGSRKVGTKATDPTVEVEGTSYEFAVEVGVDDDLPNGAYAIPNFTPPHAIHFGTQKVFVPASGATYNDVVRPMMSKLREKIDAWFQTLVGQVDASNNANAFSIKASRYATENGGGAVSADGAVRAGAHSATIQTHVRASDSPQPNPGPDPTRPEPSPSQVTKHCPGFAGHGDTLSIPSKSEQPACCILL